MKCWHCDELARASCSFCGRFVCKDHAKMMPTFLAMFLGANNTPKGLAVANVIWCGECEPQPSQSACPSCISGKGTLWLESLTGYNER